MESSEAMACSRTRLGAALTLGALALFSPRWAKAQDGDVMDEGPSDSGDWSSDESSGDSGGVNFGLRLGYALPFGDFAGTSSSSTSGGGTVTTRGGAMKDIAAGQIPIWVDLGWQIIPSFMVGAYFSYGFVILASDFKDACDQSGQSCSAGDIRTGLQVQFSFLPKRPVDPWVGAGIGYEWLRMKSTAATATARGWEIPMLQGGLDFATGASYVGPFVAFSVSSYSTVSGNGQSIDINPTASHQWLFFGVRGVMK